MAAKATKKAETTAKPKAPKSAKAKAAAKWEGAEKKATENAWTDAQRKALLALYNGKKIMSNIEIAYRMNKKFPGMNRNTVAISQRAVALRREGEKVPKRPKGKNYTSEAAIEFMEKLDARGKKKAAERKAHKDTPRRSGKADRNSKFNKSGRDPLLANDARVIEIDLGDKGGIRCEISGPLLLNDQLVANITSAVGSALTV